MESLSASVEQLCHLVWSETLGMPLLPGPEIAPADGARTIEGLVHITGRWRGTLTLQCSRPLADMAAREMLDLGPGPCALADVQDTVGELTNMLGGNVKALIYEEGCFLSLPAVVEGCDYSVHVRGARIVARHAFRACGWPLVVTLVEAGAAETAFSSPRS